MERSLASIQKIDKVEPIEGADRIDKATVLGWQVVVRKGEFDAGDKCVFFEIDSMIPDRPAFEFLKLPDKDYSNQQFVARLKTKKMKGVISQGLAMPVTTFGYDSLPVGYDVTDDLGIGKYEPPETNKTGGMVCGSFPWFIPKTDELRVQSYPNVIKEIWGLDVYVTTKMDGTSATYYLFDGDIDVCSRNNQMVEGDNVYWAVARKHNVEEKLRNMQGKFAIQGEIVGPGIQKNTADLKELTAFFFNVYDIEKKKYLDYLYARRVIEEAGLAFVPIDDKLSHRQFNWQLPELLEMAKGKYPNSSHNREGIVIRPLEERYSPTLQGRLSFKVINNDYLLKEGD